MNEHLSELALQRASILERRAKLARQVHHREEPLPRNFAEQAVDLENAETMQALDAELEESLRDVERALAAIAAGTYGTCSECGSAIAPERLQALPATRYCMDCAATREVHSTTQG